MYSKENYNNVRDLSEIPEYIKKATDNEIYATSPFNAGSSI